MNKKIAADVYTQTASDGYILRPATMEEVPAIWEIILQAKAQMYREGKHQWDENYPTVPILENDVRRGWGYVLVPDNCSTQPEPDIIAYGAVVFDGEPAYDGLRDGKWLSGQPYVVLHRLAVSDSWKRQGMAVRYMQAVCDLALSRGIRSFKVDTNYDNFYMQRVFSRLGFTYCGRIPPRLHLLRPHPLRCGRAHGLRKAAVDCAGFTTFACMKDKSRYKSVQRFASEWKDRGYEKGESQTFWLSLLRDVLGIEQPERYIRFEDKVRLDNTSFMDGYIARQGFAPAHPSE